MPIKFYARYENEQIVEVMATRRIFKLPQDLPQNNGWCVISRSVYQDALHKGLINTAHGEE